MAKENQPSNEVSVKAAISESGISMASKSRAIAAVDRLIGSLIDIPSTYFQSVIDQMQAKSEQSIRMIAAEGDAQVHEFKEQIAVELSQNIATKELKKISNKRNVVEDAMKLLMDNPLQEEFSTIPELDDDWLNYFEDYSEKASSDRMQKFWSRVLAGEIRKPKSISLSTLRFLSEVDQECAQIFERETEFCIDGEFILQPKGLKGQHLLDLLFLEEVGLLQEVISGLTVTPKPGPDGIVSVSQGQFILILETTSEVSYQVVSITRIGREIMKISPPRDHVAVLERIFENLSGEIKAATIRSMTKQSDGIIHSKVFKTLKK